MVFPPIHIKETEWYGKPRSNNIYFDDRQYLPMSLSNLKIFKIKIWSGNIYQGGVVNGIQVFYKDRTTNAIYNTMDNYGALYLVDCKEYTLDDDEYIIDFKVQSVNLVEYLELSTNKNTIINEGKITPYFPEFTFAHSFNSIIIGMKGCYGNHLNRIAFYYINKDYYLNNVSFNPFIASCTQLYGDQHINGILFNDGSLLKQKLFKYRITKIVFWIGKLYHSRIINGIRFGYQNRLKKSKIIYSEENKGKNKAIEMKEYVLEENEYLINYKIRATYFVEYIEFTTNKNRIIQEGEKIGKLVSSGSFNDNNQVILGIKGEYEADLCNVAFFYSDKEFCQQMSFFYTIKDKIKSNQERLLGKYKHDQSIYALIKTLLLKPVLCMKIFSFFKTSKYINILYNTNIQLNFHIPKGKQTHHNI